MWRSEQEVIPVGGQRGLQGFGGWVRMAHVTSVHAYLNSITRQYGVDVLLPRWEKPHRKYVLLRREGGRCGCPT